MERSEFEKRYIKVRKEAIGLDFAHLNRVQQDAVMTTSGPLLLLAGAGSGKTTVLINRIANLLRYGEGSDSDYVPEDAAEDDLVFLEEYIKSPTREMRSSAYRLCAVAPVEPWRIMAITFTNKAAGELKSRLREMLGEGADDVWAMTFHSACVRILRRDIDKMGHDRSFTIYDTADSLSLMKRILKELDLDEKNFAPRAVLGHISRAKDGYIFAEEFLSSASESGDVRRKLIGRAYVEYENRLRAANALDFDDLILMTVKLFKEHPDALEYYQKRFKYVLVDEYQDTNNLQYMLVSALSGGYRNICVVGDDDQSIYKFRGATIENILSFEQNFKNARVIRLEQNYRSTGMILDAANDVISKNTGRKGKKLWTENEPGEKPALHITGDERGEAQLVADTIISGSTQGIKFQDHAVLYRMNAQSNQLETAFKRAGVPYRIVGGTGFYDRAEIKDMLAYLCLLHNPADDLRLLRVINTPTRGIGLTTVGKITELAAETNQSMIEVMRESHKYEELAKSAGRLHLFCGMIDDLRELSGTVPLDELYDALLERTGYVKSLEEKKSDENLTRIENVRELKTNIISFMNESGGTLFDFLSETALYTDLDRDADADADRVLLMTMHSAKGLEFDTVFIVGAEEGIFPGIRSIGDHAEMEEERRLCYVAMTRAMRKLIFTSAKRRMLFGKTNAALPSRFIREINAQNIDILEDSFNGFEFDFEVDFDDSREYQPRVKKPLPRFDSSVSAPSPAEPPEFKKGDMVQHKAFGRGLITNVSAAGGDALLEIAFDDSGTKRLMQKSAARYMGKV